jgi:hypothetical protein
VPSPQGKRDRLRLRHWFCEGDVNGQLACVADEQGYLPCRLVWGHPRVLCVVPGADQADLCSEPVAALALELDEGEHDGQAAEDAADR